MELAIIIVALMVLGSLLSSGHALPQEIATLSRGQRLDLPYAKEAIRMIYKVATTWRVERVAPQRNALTQHFEVITPPYSQTRKVL